jgi:hypothetical protein
MSKVGLTALTKVQQRLFNSDSRTDIVVNACCPGYVATGNLILIINKNELYSLYLF